MITKKPLNCFQKILKNFSVTKYFYRCEKIPTRCSEVKSARFSEKKFMKFWKMDISKMSKIRYIGKSLYEKSVVPFFKYFQII